MYSESTKKLQQLLDAHDACRMTLNFGRIMEMLKATCLCQARSPMWQVGNSTWRCKEPTSTSSTMLVGTISPIVQLELLNSEKDDEKTYWQTGVIRSRTKLYR